MSNIGKLVIVFMTVLAGCSSLEEPRDIRSFGGISKQEIVLAMREGFINNEYRVETISVESGEIKAVSPELDRDLVWFVPWRKDRWVITTFVEPLGNDEGYKISASADPEEKGVLESSEWKPRGQLSRDRDYILDLIQEIESTLISKGATLK